MTELRTIDLRLLFNMRELDYLVDLIAAENWDLLKEFLHSPEVVARLHVNEILPQYLFDWFQRMASQTWR